MKILFVLENHYPNIGGVETLFKNLTESLVKEGHQISVLTNQFSSELKRKENLNGVDIIRVPFKNRYLFTFLGFFSAFKYARKHDLIHTTSYNAGVPAFIAGILARKKVIITFHEVWSKLWFGLPYMSKPALWLHYIFEWFLLKLPFFKFVAVSEYTRQSLIEAGISKQKISLIYNGIQYGELLEMKSEIEQELVSESNPQFSFLYFGRLGISKGLDIILDALEILKAKAPAPFILNLVIPSLPKNFHQLIVKAIQDKNLEDVINIQSDLPWKQLVREILKSDAVIIPSYSEGFCFTAVETMALGKPIISSGKGALAEVICGKHIVMSTQDGDGLFKAMTAAIDNKWTTTPENKFTLDKSISGYLEMYESIIKTALPR